MSKYTFDKGRTSLSSDFGLPYNSRADKYSITFPYIPPDGFIKALLESIEGNFAADTAYCLAGPPLISNVAVFGSPFSGKTSLCHYLADIMLGTEDNWLDDLSDEFVDAHDNAVDFLETAAPVYITFGGPCKCPKIDSVDKFWSEVLVRIAYAITYMPNDYFSMKNYHSFYAKYIEKNKSFNDIISAYDVVQCLDQHTYDSYADEFAGPKHNRFVLIIEDFHEVADSPLLVATFLEQILKLAVDYHPSCVHKRKQIYPIIINPGHSALRIINRRGGIRVSSFHLRCLTEKEAFVASKKKEMPIPEDYDPKVENAILRHLVHYGAGHPRYLDTVFNHLFMHDNASQSESLMIKSALKLKIEISNLVPIMLGFTYDLDTLSDEKLVVVSRMLTTKWCVGCNSGDNRIEPIVPLPNLRTLLPTNGRWEDDVMHPINAFEKATPKKVPVAQNMLVMLRNIFDKTMRDQWSAKTHFVTCVEGMHLLLHAYRDHNPVTDINSYKPEDSISMKALFASSSLANFKDIQLRTPSKLLICDAGDTFSNFIAQTSAKPKGKQSADGFLFVFKPEQHGSDMGTWMRDPNGMSVYIGYTCKYLGFTSEAFSVEAMKEEMNSTLEKLNTNMVIFSAAELEEQIRPEATEFKATFRTTYPREFFKVRMQKKCLFSKPLGVLSEEHFKPEFIAKYTEVLRGRHQRAGVKADIVYRVFVVQPQHITEDMHQRLPPKTIVYSTDAYMKRAGPTFRSLMPNGL